MAMKKDRWTSKILNIITSDSRIIAQSESLQKVQQEQQSLIDSLSSK